MCISIQWSISNYFSLPKLSYMSSNYCAMYFLIQKLPTSVSFVVSYNLKTFVVRVCSYVLWNPQRLSATVLKSAPGQNSKCFCLKALIFPRGKYPFHVPGNYCLNRKDTLNLIESRKFSWDDILFLSLWRRWNKWGLNWAERLHIFCTYKCTIF